MKRFFFKSATFKDSSTLISWRNDPVVRKNSFNNKKIEFKNHNIWFKKQISRKKNFFWIFHFNNEKIGFVRLIYEKKKYILNYLISKKFRKKNLGKIMLNLMIKKLKKKKTLSKLIVANVKNNNLASKKTLFSIGFIEKKKKFNEYSKLNFHL